MKLRILTPMYGGMCTCNYLTSMLEAQRVFMEMGIQVGMHLLENESLVPRARNKLVHMFMASDATHCLFWDADLGVEADDLRLMLHFGQKEEYKVLAGMYSTKGVEWPQIRQGVLADPLLTDDEMAELGSRYVLNTSDGKLSGKLGKPQEVLEAATGLMLIQREVFEEYQDKYPDSWYMPIIGDNPIGGQPEGTKMWAYFDSGIYPAYGTQAYLSEDYAFSARWRAIGGKVWVAPWTRTVHKGTYNYRADLRMRTLHQQRHQQRHQQQVGLSEKAGV